MYFGIAFSSSGGAASRPSRPQVERAACGSTRPRRIFRPVDQRAYRRRFERRCDLPYAIAVGNHDMDAWSRGGYDAVAADRRTATFNTYFSYGLFSTYFDTYKTDVHNQFTITGVRRPRT
jgi:hypothetical protein